MQIHELNNYNGNLDSGAYLAVDDGTDTGKISVQGLLSGVTADIEEEETTRAEADAVLRQAIDNAAIVPAGSTVVVDSTLTISGAAADAKVTGDIKSDLSLYDDGEKRFPGTYTFTELDASGDIVDRPDHKRAAIADYYTAVIGDILTIITGFGAIICKYDSNNTLLSRNVVPAGTYDLEVGKKYRICVFYSDSRVISSLNEVNYVALLPTETEKKFDVLDERVEDLEQKRKEIAPVWNSGYYVNNATQQLAPFSNFYYSDLIELAKGEGIKVEQGYTNTATVVDMLSEWNGNGTYLDSIFPYSSTGYSNSSLYRATKNKEYVRVCFYNYNNEVIDKIKVFKYEAENVVIQEEVTELCTLPSISMFERVGFCGDSYVKAQLYDSDGLVGDRPNLSWGKNIGRMFGITADIFASSGADTNTWQSRADCLPALLASQNPCGLYVFCLGINDDAYVTLGSMDDITDYESYTQYPNTFYGNYGKIIEQIMAYSADSKIILMTPYHPSYNKKYVTPLTEISEHYGIAMIDTNYSPLCSDADFTSMLVHGHPTAVLQSAMARDISYLIGKCFNDYYSYFAEYFGI